MIGQRGIAPGLIGIILARRRLGQQAARLEQDPLHPSQIGHRHGVARQLAVDGVAAAIGGGTGDQKGGEVGLGEALDLATPGQTARYRQAREGGVGEWHGRGQTRRQIRSALHHRARDDIGVAVGSRRHIGHAGERRQPQTRHQRGVAAVIGTGLAGQGDQGGGGSGQGGAVDAGHQGADLVVAGGRRWAEGVQEQGEVEPGQCVVKGGQPKRRFGAVGIVGHEADGVDARPGRRRLRRVIAGLRRRWRTGQTAEPPGIAGKAFHQGEVAAAIVGNRARQQRPALGTKLSGHRLEIGVAAEHQRTGQPQPKSVEDGLAGGVGPDIAPRRQIVAHGAGGGLRRFQHQHRIHQPHGLDQGQQRRRRSRR